MCSKLVGRWYEQTEALQLLIFNICNFRSDNNYNKHTLIKFIKINKFLKLAAFRITQRQNCDKFRTFRITAVMIRNDYKILF